MTRILIRCCKSTFVMLLFFALGNTALAQTTQPPTNLYEALKAQNIPSTIRADELTADWHYIRFELQDENSNSPGFLLTKGDTILFGGQPYLAAYRLLQQPNTASFDPQEYLLNQWRRKQHDRMTPPLLKDTILNLSLLPFSSKNHFFEIKLFDPETDITIAPTETAVNRENSLTNLKQVALALFMYVQDHHETLPPMIAARSADEIKTSYSSIPPPPGAPPLPPGYKQSKVTATTSVQTRLMPYLMDKSRFLQPATFRPYLPNYKISRWATSKIDNPNKTFLFYEDAPDANGMRCVAFADGHVKAISEAEFQSQRKAQGISESGYPSAAKPTHKAKATPKP